MIDTAQATAWEIIQAAWRTGGEELPEGVSKAILAGPLLQALDDEILLALPMTLDGLTFTHGVTAEERSAGAVPLDPDLAALREPAELGVRTLAGASLVLDDGPSPALLRGPQGWLDAAPTDGLTAFRLDGAVLRVSPATLTDDADEVAAVLVRMARRLLRRPGRRDEPPLVREVVWHAHAFDRAALTDEPRIVRAVTRPLGDILRGAGIRCDGEHLVPGRRPVRR